MGADGVHFAKSPITIIAALEAQAEEATNASECELSNSYIIRIQTLLKRV